MYAGRVRKLFSGRVSGQGDIEHLEIQASGIARQSKQDHPLPGNSRNGVTESLPM